ncbi:Insulin peptide receptor [Tropilaelaps mercedesae]|uniref:Insulin peptide receptor n=1 Tax=Tropilaelaps mercedesae TaxID=418985 RepID=A0A1V9X113_9ACAR|nr:Insulin peptide receptor [Tropilaelaps mercedesae]
MATAYKSSPGNDPTASLDTIKRKNHRIIIADVKKEVGLHTLCAAHKLEMTWRQKYVWVLPSWLPKGWFNVSKDELPAGCTMEHIENAVNLSFTYRFKEVEDDSFEINAGFKNVLEWKTTFNGTIVPYAGYAYDAIWTLANSLDKLNSTRFIPSVLDPFRKRLYMAKWIQTIKRNSFNEVTGTVSFRSTTRQSQPIYLDQYVAGEYKPEPRSIKTSALNDDDEEFKIVHKILWPLGRPTDGSAPSGSKGCQSLIKGLAAFLRIECEIATAIAIVVIVLASIIAFGFVGGALVYRHYEKKVRLIEQQQDSSLSSLSEYELPEDSVRIYRSLGEGAFGKVYLGEYLKEEGCVFAVAIKAARDPKNLNAKLVVERSRGYETI